MVEKATCGLINQIVNLNKEVNIVALDPNLEIAKNYREKFEFYFVGLTFAILGLSIQTSIFGTHVFSDICEVAGWICLLLSGIFSLKRIEWIPIVHEYVVKKAKIDKDSDELLLLKKAGQKSVQMVDGKTKDIDELIENKKWALEKVEEYSSEAKMKIYKRHKYRWDLFVFGIVLLTASRIFGPLRSIYNMLTTC